MRAAVAHSRDLRNSEIHNERALYRACHLSACYLTVSHSPVWIVLASKFHYTYVVHANKLTDSMAALDDDTWLTDQTVYAPTSPPLHTCPCHAGHFRG